MKLVMKGKISSFLYSEISENKENIFGKEK